MTRMAIRLDRLERSRPVPVPPLSYDLGRLSDDQLERLAVLAERIELVGAEGLTPDEMHEMAELMAILEENTACPAPC